MSGALEPLYDLQRDPRRRWVATLVAAAAGLLLASVHWSGLLAGGALIGWTMPTLRRALLAGVGFGMVALFALAASLSTAGTLGPATELGAITHVTVAIPLVLGTLGGLSRGLVSDAPDEL